MVRPAYLTGSLPSLSATPGVGWRETGSKSRMSRLFIYMDGQDRQDYLARGFTVLSSTIVHASTRIPKTRSQAHGSPQTHTRSLSQSASPASAFYPEPFAKFGVGHEMGAECSCKITPSKRICTWLAMGFPGTTTLPDNKSRFLANFAKGSPVYPVYPVYPCSLIQQTNLTGHGPCSQQAKRICCFTLV